MQLNQAKIREPYEAKNDNKGASRVSAFTEDFKGEFYNISPDKLLPYKKQARRVFDEESINQLASTIKEHGIMNPLNVIPSENGVGTYEVVSGERRLRAAIKAGLTQVPCIIIKDKDKAEEIAIIENVQRKDLHPLELLNGYLSLMDKGLSQQDIVKRVGVNRTSLIDVLNLRQLDPEVKEKLLKHDIYQRDFLRSLCKKQPSIQKIHLDRYINKLSQEGKEGRKILHTKSKILTVVLKGENIIVEKNAIEALSEDKKKAVKELLFELIS